MVTTERIKITIAYAELTLLESSVNKFLETDVGELKDIAINYIPNDPNLNMNRRNIMYYAVIRYVPMKK